MTSPLFAKKVMVAVAIGVVIAVAVVVATPRVKEVADRKVVEMMKREAAIGQATAKEASADCTVENGCVGKGPQGTYPTEASLLQSVPVRASHQQSATQAQPSSKVRVPPIVAASLIFVLGLVALGVLILIGGSGRGSR